MTSGMSMHDAPAVEAAIKQMLGGGHAHLQCSESSWSPEVCKSVAESGRGVTLIVYSSPTGIAQFCSRLEMLGTPSAFVHPERSRNESISSVSRFTAKTLKVFAVPASRFLTQSFASAASNHEVTAVIIDDAAQVADGLNGARHERTFASVLPHVPRLAVTRSLDRAARETAVATLGLKEPKIASTEIPAENLSFSCHLRVSPYDMQLLDILKDEKGRGLVYASTSKQASELAGLLSSQGLIANEWHDDVPDDRLSTALGALRSGSGAFTVAVSGGLAFPDDVAVDFTIHMATPHSTRLFLDEIACLRQREKASCHVIYGYKDMTEAAKSFNKEMEDEGRQRAQAAAMEMFRFADTVQCREIALAENAGLTIEQTCGRCDNCREPPKVFDATEHATLALSCVYRAGIHGCGATNLVNTLIGEAKSVETKKGLTELPIYGKGAHITPRRWWSVYRQLIAAGYIVMNGKGHLDLTEKTREFFTTPKDARKVMLRDEDERTLEENRAARIEQRLVAVDDITRSYFEELDSERKTIGEGLNTRDYFVFADDFVLLMARTRPETLEELMAIPGIRPMNAELYGPRMIKAIERVRRRLT